jgi:hypothetical protein
MFYGQELLECPDVDARHYAATGECMPQIVSMEIRNLRCLDDVIPPKAGLLQRVTIQWHLADASVLCPSERHSIEMRMSTLFISSYQNST